MAIQKLPFNSRLDVETLEVPIWRKIYVGHQRPVYHISLVGFYSAVGRRGDNLAVSGAAAQLIRTRNTSSP